MVFSGIVEEMGTVVSMKKVKEITLWDGSKGPEWPIRSGISAKVKIIYKQRLPISYVLPWVKSITGIDDF